MDFQQEHVSLIHFFPYKSKKQTQNKQKNHCVAFYCCACEKRPHLEPIQEESEVEDEPEEIEEKEFQSSVGHEDDEEDELTVLRPKRVSRSHSHSFPQVQLNRSQQKETGQLSSSPWNISAPPKRSFNFSRLKQQKDAPPKASVRRRTRTRRHRKDTTVSFSHQLYLYFG